MEDSRRLLEWKDTKGNRVSLSSTGPASSTSSASATKSTSYKERFEKLLNYHLKYRPTTIKKTEIKTITDNLFSCKNLIETNGSSWTQGTIVKIMEDTEHWVLCVWIDDRMIDDIEGDGWEDLLRALSFYLTTPNVGTPKYNELLEAKSTKTFSEEFKLYESLWG